MIFHCVKHSISYNAQDCSNKLLPKILPHSAIAKKVSCGRIKSEAIVKEILGALAEKYVEAVFKAKEGNEFNDVYFNVMTNKGNRKMYAICVQFVSFDKGCQTRLLDLFECSSETADAISNNI